MKKNITFKVIETIFWFLLTLKLFDLILKFVNATTELDDELMFLYGLTIIVASGSVFLFLIIGIVVASIWEKDTESLKQQNKKLKLDPLTNCYNRHRYNELQANSKEQEYYVSVVDLNGLKTINDMQGHLVGDNAIKELAEFLKGFGEAIRMGGDEFLVIAGKPHAELSGKFEKYCSATVHKAKGMDLESAYDSADKQMLREKKL